MEQSPYQVPASNSELTVNSNVAVGDNTMASSNDNHPHHGGGMSCIDEWDLISDLGEESCLSTDSQDRPALVDEFVDHKPPVPTGVSASDSTGSHNGSNEGACDESAEGAGAQDATRVRHGSPNDATDAAPEAGSAELSNNAKGNLDANASTEHLHHLVQQGDSSSQVPPTTHTNEDNGQSEETDVTDENAPAAEHPLIRGYPHLKVIHRRLIETGTRISHGWQSLAPRARKRIVVGVMFLLAIAMISAVVSAKVANCRTKRLHGQVEALQSRVELLEFRLTKLEGDLRQSQDQQQSCDSATVSLNAGQGKTKRREYQSNHSTQRDGKRRMKDNMGGSSSDRQPQGDQHEYQNHHDDHQGKQGKRFCFRSFVRMLSHVLFD
jgi:hypothetical protein